MIQPSRAIFRPTPHALLLVLAAAACGGDGDGDGGIDPTDVRFGDTALVVVVNPAVNDGNKRAVPMPGAVRSGVTVRSDDGLADTTGDDGIAVLAPLSAGARTFTVSGGGIDGTFTVTMGAGELREIALAADGTRAEVMPRRRRDAPGQRDHLRQRQPDPRRADHR